MFPSINSPPAGIMKQIPQRKNMLLLNNLLYHLHVLLLFCYPAFMWMERESVLTAWGMAELSVTCVTGAIPLR